MYFINNELTVEFRIWICTLLDTSGLIYLELICTSTHILNVRQIMFLLEVRFGAFIFWNYLYYYYYYYYYWNFTWLWNNQLNVIWTLSLTSHSNKDLIVRQFGQRINVNYCYIKLPMELFQNPSGPFGREVILSKSWQCTVNRRQTRSGHNSLPWALCAQMS